MTNDRTLFEKELNTLLADSHPQTALEKASEEFTLTPKEQNIIRSHMWPLTLFHPPKSKEAFLVSLADKYCAAREMYLKKR